MVWDRSREDPGRSVADPRRISSVLVCLPRPIYDGSIPGDVLFSVELSADSSIGCMRVKWWAWIAVLRVMRKKIGNADLSGADRDRPSGRDSS